jgi:hypothetical protein
MQTSEIRQPVMPPDEHTLTTTEALEPLFLQLQAQVDRMLIVAAIDAGWSSDDIVLALDRLRKPDSSAKP